MRILFWSAGALFLYTYVGYPAFLWARSFFRRRPVKQGVSLPSVSVVIAVRNEALRLPPKLNNLAGLDYPAEKIEIVIASDGSSDTTNQLLRDAGNGVRAVICEKALGKAAALNHALAMAKNEIVVFTDARQMLDRGAIRRLVANFEDSEIGCVSGELMLGDQDTGPLGTGVGFYWQLEKLIRRLEAASGSVVGATGALYAVRRALVSTIPPDTILDDVMIPMRVARAGHRVIFESHALAWDTVSAVRHHEFRRKVRTLFGNYQLLTLEPWLLSRKNPLLLEYVSHKLLRLLSPLMMLTLLIVPLGLTGGVYRSAFIIQLVFYVLATLAWILPNHSRMRRAADCAYAFVTLNLAAAVAFLFFVTGRRQVWTR